MKMKISVYEKRLEGQDDIPSHNRAFLKAHLGSIQTLHSGHQFPGQPATLRPRADIAQPMLRFRFPRREKHQMRVLTGSGPGGGRRVYYLH